MGQIIAVANQKGGVGKTTTTINLGAYLALAGNSVLIVDFDPQANTTSGLGFDKRAFNETVYDGLFNPDLVSQLIQSHEIGNLSLLPANQSLANAEINLVSAESREHRLHQLLSQLDFDYVLIDCPPSLGLLTVNALRAADYVIVPVQAEYYAMEGLGQLLETITQVRDSLNPDLELLGVLLTMMDGRTSLSTQVHEELKRHFPGKTMDVVIPRNVRLAEAPSHGKTIAQHDRWSKGARSYKQLAKEIKHRTKTKAEVA